MFCQQYLCRHGLVMSGEPREPAYRVKDWLWEAKRARSGRGRALYLVTRGARGLGQDPGARLAGCFGVERAST